MADINFMEVFLNNDDLLPSLERDIFKTKKAERNDEEQLEWISDDFLDSILKPTIDDCTPLFDQFLYNANDLINGSTNIDCSSDSGLSCEQDRSPTRSVETVNNGSVDEFLSDNAVSSLSAISFDLNGKNLSDVDHVDDTVEDETCFAVSMEPAFDAVEYVKEEVVECEEVFDSVSLSDSNSRDSTYDTFIIQNGDQADDEVECDLSVLITKSPLKLYPEKKIKTMNSAFKSRGKRLRQLNDSNADNVLGKRKHSEVSDDVTSDDSDFVYPRLHLTPEEQKLAVKEGIKLPSHYPLTKVEERELKRIRRKIRNKISAQDSRRRKKEYVDGLEERVKKTSEENAHLMKRIKTLESQKMTLVAQVRKLQATLARYSGQTAQPSTCLLVLIMSLALVLAPTLQNSAQSADSGEDEGISLSEEGTTPLNTAGRSRTLLFSQKAHEGQCNLDEEAKTLTEQLEKMQLPDSNVLTGILDMLKLKFVKKDSQLKEHDYFRPRKRAASGFAGDESWPPPKISKQLMSELKTIASTIVVDNNNKSEARNGNNNEPVVIDLLSD